MSAKRVILYRPPPRAHVTPFPQRTVPVGLMTIASTLRTRGDHDVRLVDGFEGQGPEELARLAKDWDADVVGVSGMTAHAYDAMVAAHLVKEANPKTLVVVGGIHFSAVTEMFPKFGSLTQSLFCTTSASALKISQVRDRPARLGTLSMREAQTFLFLLDFFGLFLRR